MADMVKQIFGRPIQLADQVTKLAGDAHSSRQECAELKSKTTKLASLLRQAARASSDLYERPTRRIVEETEQVLDKALVLVTKCRANGLLKRVFTIIPNAAFKKMFSQLENTIGDVSWLLRVSASAEDRGDEYLGLPPIAANEPILCLIWEQIATLVTGSLDDRSDAAASLVSLARDNERYGKLIIEEGGVGPLLKLLKEGRLEGQENAARAIGLLARDEESVEHVVLSGVCSVFAKILKEGSMKVQSVVAWTVAEMASHHPKCQDHFLQNNIVRLLISHLAFETVQEHSKYAVASKAMSIHHVVKASNDSNRGSNNDKIHYDDNDDVEKLLFTQVKRPAASNRHHDKMHAVIESTMTSQSQNQAKQNRAPTHCAVKDHRNSHSVTNKGRDKEDPAIKASMKAMAAKALRHLAKGNSSICRSITESRALLCFSILLEKGTGEVQFNSAMALMEIAAVAEQDSVLRQAAFKPSSPAAKAVIDQLLRTLEKADSDLLIPCIRAIGFLARTFRATETRIIGPLVRLLDESEGEVSQDAVIALNKFACSENYLHLDHCKAIINAGGVKHLIQLMYFGEQIVKTSTLILLCYIAMHVPDSEALAQAEVLNALDWASKQGCVLQNEAVEKLLPEAKSRLELYQSRGSRGFH